nr:hypothetical protein HmN_000907000 [Hymenolepis microstoma]
MHLVTLRDFTDRCDALQNSMRRQSPSHIKLWVKLISLVGLDRIDELHLIQFPGQNESGQAPTLEPTNGEGLIRGCYQCRHVAKILYPTLPV